jgi:predicted SnoaL-like aldol condensation-catalyzing enzyme
MPSNGSQEMTLPRTCQRIATACVLLNLAACAAQSTVRPQNAACDSSPAGNKATVLSFYQLGLTNHRPREAFERYASADMLEHKPDVPDGTRTAVVQFLEQLIAELPKAQWELLRVVSEGDLVFVHARFLPAPESPAYAIADLFRLKDCRIVEHWDVVGPPRPDQPNPNSRF